MRLVDRDQVDARGPREIPEVVGPQAFRRDVEDAQASAMRHVVDAPALPRGDAAVDQGGRHSPGAQCLNLVAHEGAQRGYDDGQTSLAHRGKLVAHALAAAGGHDRDQVAPVEDRVDGLELAGTERGVPVGPVELGQGGVRIVAKLTVTYAAGFHVQIVDVHGSPCPLAAPLACRTPPNTPIIS